MREGSRNVSIAAASVVLCLMLVLPTGFGHSPQADWQSRGQGYGSVTISTGQTLLWFYLDESLGVGARRLALVTSQDGASWSDPVFISNPTPSIKRVSAAADDGDVCVAWEDGASRAMTSYLATSVDSGATWTAPFELGGAAPSIAVSNGQLWAVTTGADGGVNVCSGGFGSVLSLERTGFSIACGEAAVGIGTDGTPFIVFHGGVPGSPGEGVSGAGIYMTVPSGGSWAEPAKLCDSPGSNHELCIEGSVLGWERSGHGAKEMVRMQLPSWGGAPLPPFVESVEPIPDNSVGGAPGPLDNKKWTYVLYCDADNNLASYGAEDVDELELVGSDANINLIALADFSAQGGFTESATRCYYITYNSQTQPSGGYTSTSSIHSATIPLTSINASWTTNELNMGNPQTAIDLMKYVYINYPSDRYCFDFWNHGGSWNWMQCSDDASGGDCLTALETRGIYEKLRTQTGRTLLWDVLTFDECLLADVEVFYDAKQYCDYVVASEDSIGGDGYEYNLVTAHWKTNPLMNGEEFGYWICREYFNVYGASGGMTTLSLINNTAFDYDMMPLVNSWAQKMRHKAQALNAQIKSAASSAVDWQGYTYQPDMTHFAKLITTGITNSTDAEICRAAWKVVVKSRANARTDTYNSPTWVHDRPILIHNGNTNENGITVYANQNYNTVYNSLREAVETNWGKFVQSVWKASPSNPLNDEPACSITSPANGSTANVGSLVTISGTASDLGDNGTSLQLVQVKVDREAWQNATGTASWSWSWNTAGASPGTHRLQARSWDGLDYSERLCNLNVTLVQAVQASFRIPVVLGWNLISTPLVPSSGSLPGVLADAQNDTTWRRAMGYNPGTPTDLWKQYNAGFPSAMNDLKSVDEMMGLWLNVETLGDGYLNVTGTLPSSTPIVLKAGWNLVGYPAQDDGTYTVGNLKTMTGATFVEGFSSGATYKTQALSDAFVMKRGQGYWVCVPVDTTWTVNW